MRAEVARAEHRGKLRVATRRSKLALAQTRAFCAALIARNPGLEIEELQVVTAGDRILDRPLAEIGGKGLFVKEIEEALLENRADFAVHSMKDLPAALPLPLWISCVPERADPRDVLLARLPEHLGLDSLPPRARVGSASQRRRHALLDARADLDVVSLRGNVDTRLRRLSDGDFDAIILAAAGLHRLGLGPTALPAHVFLSPEVMLPAVTQGALAIESRRDDAATTALLSLMEDPKTRHVVSAERAVLVALGADCTVPLAAFAELAGDTLTLRGTLWLDGVRRSGRREGPALAGEELGRDLGSWLRAT